MFRTAQRCIGASGGGEDRSEIHDRGDRIVIVVADGAGGTGGGARAAETVLRRVREQPDDFDPMDVLRACDALLALTGGQTTAVIAIVDDLGVHGASVGDSGAWIVRGDSHEDLTRDQSRKPILGSGARPVAFSSGPLDGTLLVATDGVLKYAPAPTLRRLAAGGDLDAAAAAMIDAARLGSGALQDDATVVICRRQE
jgi:serine/threonine protein phosphatase PrpC